MMSPEQKQYIDEASLETLLAKWRFAPVGDPMLAGDTGDYYSARMKHLRSESAEDWTAASKRIGWGP